MKSPRRKKRRERLLVGLVGLPILYLALLVLSPSETSRFYYVYLWMHFATIGLWISYLVPKLVRRGPEGPILPERGASEH